MASNASVSDRELALRIIDSGVQELAANTSEVWRFGTHWVFSEEECAELKSVSQSIADYVAAPAVPSPLGIAVFGPPGCGKSTVVRVLLNEVEQSVKAQDGSAVQITELNLTQVSDLTVLINQLTVNIKAARDSSKVPIFFIDEFDSTRAGIPLGWLGTFLAPLEDSLVGSDNFKGSKIVFIFAGGTAHRMEDFGLAHPEQFRIAKGPDFTSRLGGYLNIRGPNDPKRRDLRRAVLIRSVLERNGIGRKLDGALAQEILNEGRFRHGSRSLATIILMAARKAEQRNSQLITKEDTPSEQILTLHTDQGPLDPDTIGGLIGLSFGSELQEDPEKGRLGQVIAERLWREGAALGYGGRPDRDLTRELLLASRRLTKPTASHQERIEVYARLSINEIEPKDEEGVRTIPIRLLGISDRDEEGLKSAVLAFRMRWMMICRSAAQIIVGGKTSGYSGRMPGILEECVLALALKRPLFVLGVCGGMAAVVGELLGIGDSSDEDRSSLQIPPREDAVREHSYLFLPFGTPDLPNDVGAAIVFVSSHAVAGPNWPWNGLTVQENRELFSARDPDQIASMILKGLLRRTASQTPA